MTKKKKWAYVILISIGFLSLFYFSVYKFLDWIYIDEVVDTSRRNDAYRKQKDDLFPKITSKLELMKNDKIQLTNEEVKTLILIRSCPANLSDLFRTNIENDIDQNIDYYRDFSSLHPNTSNNITRWLNGELELSKHDLLELVDAYYGFISSTTHEEELQPEEI